MNKNLNFPPFRGSPLVETPDVPMIGYLKGDFGEWFLKTYNSVVDEKYKGNSVLKVLSFSDDVVKGSSTFSSIIAAGILRQRGLELAGPADVERARRLHESDPHTSLDTRGQYVDYGLVFRSVAEPNRRVAKALEPQIKKALKVETIKVPIVLLSGDLKIVNDRRAENGLGIALRKEAKLFPAPMLKNNISFNETDENGLPVPDESGARMSYTTEGGLSRLNVNRGLGVGSYWDPLAGSDPDGRVVGKKK